MTNKSFNILFFNALFLVLLFTSCSKDAIEPDFQFDADRNTVSVNENVTFTITGSADGMAIYTGDDGHRFEDSYLAVTNGKDIETETVYLTAEKFQELKSSTVISNPAIIDSVGTLVGTRYKGRSHPEFLITLFYDYEVSAAKVDEIMAFFTVENVKYTPANGFSTGIAVDVTAKSKVYQYKYNAPGTYTATLVATNTGRKDFKNSDTHLPDEEDYDKKYITKTIVITVQ